MQIKTIYVLRGQDNNPNCDMGCEIVKEEEEKLSPIWTPIHCVNQI